MITIKEYLTLKEIMRYLETEKENKDREGYDVINHSNDKLFEMIETLGKIIYKLEKED